jgi:hypothetical protein
MKQTIAIITCLAASPAIAQTCGPRAPMVETLVQDFDAAVIWQGLTGSGMMLEIWEGPNMWLAIITRPDGVSCIAEGGQMSALVPTGAPV